MVDMHFFEMISDPVLVLNKQDGIISINHSLEELFGFSRHEVVGKHNPPFWAYQQDFVGYILGVQARMSGSHPKKDIIMDCLVKSGGPPLCSKVSLHVQEERQQLNVICLFKRCFSSGKELSLDIFCSIADHTNVMMGVLDLLEEEGDIYTVMINQSAAEFVCPGSKPEMLIGKKSIADHGFRKEDIAFWIEYCHECEEANRPLHKCLYIHPPYSGQKRWLQCTVDFVGRTPEGRSRFCYIVEDVTKAKEAEDESHRQSQIHMQELEAKNKALLEAQHEKDEFMLSISHELRTPISGIIGLTEELLEKEISSDGQRQVSFMIRKSAEELLTLIDDILHDFEKVRTRHAKFNLQQIIRTTAESALTQSTPHLREKRSCSVPCISTKNRPPEHRILLAEDNLVNQRVIERHLKKLGFAVDIVEDGSKAVEMLKRKGTGYYSLILMDLFMPNMNGLEATTEIRKWESEKLKTPIIALTANVMGDLREKCLLVGMDEFLSKPCSSQTLHQTVAKFLLRDQCGCPEASCNTLETIAE